MPDQPPGFFQKVRNFLGASAKEGVSRLSGDPEMPAGEISRRRGICHSNACGHYDPAADRCFACGCNVEKKIAWRTASCPEGHWPALSPVIVPSRPPAP